MRRKNVAVAIQHTSETGGTSQAPYYEDAIQQIQNMTSLSHSTVWRWVKKYDWVITTED